MAEFDSNAFSAVDNFFVIDRKADDALVDKNNEYHKTGAKVAKRRLGVGASVQKKEPAGFAAAATSKFLQVDKKKRNRAEEDENVNQDDDDDEDELGRTSIVSDPKSREEGSEAIAADSTAKKNKKGRKERQKEKLEETDIAEAAEGSAFSEDTHSPKGNVDAILETRPKESTNKEPRGADNNHRKKRRKVRSKQKNIYKDNRSLEEKPDHLIPGGYEYRGRPITPETRSKLIAKNALPLDSKETDHKIDDTKVDSGVPIVEDSKKIEDANKQGKKGKGKKTKYKNLK
jgi:hypothetical protein